MYIRHSTDGRSNTKNPKKIRHPKKGASDVEYSTFDYAADRIEKIRSDK